MSHSGKIRAVNEDRWALPPQATLGVNDIFERGSLYLVADGVGGHLAGAIAAEIAVRTTLENYYAEPIALFNSTTEVAGHLCNAIAQAQLAILTKQRQSAEFLNMGTTIVAAIIWKSHLIVANVGDSRCYHLRNNTLRQLSVDHSLLEEQKRKGLLQAENEVHEVNRSILVRALGSPENATPDVSVYDWGAGDRLLLCTDGLWGLVAESDIAANLSHGNVTISANHLIQLALDAGGDDNITVIVIGELQTAVRSQSTLPMVAVDTHKPDSGNATAETTAKKTKKIPQRLLYFLAAIIFTCIGATLAIFTGTALRNNTLLSGFYDTLGGLFEIGKPTAVYETPRVIPGDSWQAITPDSAVPTALQLPTITSAPIITATSNIIISTVVPVSTSLPTAIITQAQTSTNPISASVTPQLTQTQVTLVTTKASNTPTISVTLTPTLPRTTPTLALSATPDVINLLTGVRLCSGAQILEKNCLAVPSRREFVVTDDEIFVFWQNALPVGTQIRVQWLRNGRQLGNADTCIITSTACANFDITANYVRLRIKDIQGDKTGNFAYKVFLNETLQAEEEFIIR